MSCVLDGAPQPLVFHLYHVAHCCSQKCCLLRRKPGSQSSGNKARIVSVCSSSRCPSFSFPLRSLPLPLLLLFQLLLPSPFIFSLPAGTGSRFTFPQGWGQLSRAFPTLLRGKGHCRVSSPVIPLPFHGRAHLSPPGSSSQPQGCSPVGVLSC